MKKKFKLISYCLMLLMLFNFIFSSVPISFAMGSDDLQEIINDEPVVPIKPKITFGPHRSDVDNNERAYEPFADRDKGDFEEALAEHKKDKVNIKIKQPSNNKYSTMGSNSENIVGIDLKKYGISEIEEIKVDSKGEDVALFGMESDRESHKWFNATLENGCKVEEVITLLKDDTSILVAEPDYIRKVKGEAVPVPSGDPGLLQQWYLEKAGITDAWDYLESTGQNPGGDRDIIVAVIDTGVDYTHPDLQGNMWINSGEVSGNGRDDDGNSYVDDIHGADTITRTGNPQDDHGHGTHVAGIIGAMAQNNEGGVGVAFNVQIMAIKAAQSSGILSSSDVAKAINYAVNMGADVINMSFGGYGRSVLEEDALQRAFGSAVLVAAAGNDGINNEPAELGRPMYPAAYNWVLGVMAQNQYPDARGDNLAPFSNWDIIPQDSFEYEIMAPGVEMYSTLPNGKYAKWSGTSMAAPVVAGVAALLRSQFSDKSMYSSRFIMGQLAATGDLKQGKTYSMSAPPTKHRELNAYKAITNTPKPEITYLEHYTFDKKNIDLVNNEDGIADAGETLDIALTIRNHWGKADDVQVTIDTLSPAGIADTYVEFINDSVNYGAVGSFNIDDNGLIYDDENTITGVRTPFTIKLAKDTPNDHLIKFNVNIESKNGYDANDGQIYRTTSSFYLTVRNGTVLPRVINEDMVLDKDTYWIIPDATLIPEGVTVTVEPGTQIQFWGSDPSDPYAEQQMAYLQVEGSFMVNGTEDEPVDIFASKLYPGYEVKICSEGKLDYQGSMQDKLSGKSQISYTNITNPKIWIDEVDHCYFSQDLYDEIYVRYEDGGEIKTTEYHGPVVFANKIILSRFYNLGRVDSNSNYVWDRLQIHGKACGNIFDSCNMSLNNVVAKDNIFLKNYKLYKSQYGDREYRTSKAEDWGLKIVTEKRMDVVFPVYREENNSTYFAINPNMYEIFSKYINSHGHKYVVKLEMEFVERFANSLGGNIVTINDEEENQFIQSYINDNLMNSQKWEEQYPGKSNYNFGRNHLIGINDFDMEGNYKWISKEESSYFNWDTNEPQKQLSDYGYNLVGLSYSNGKWHSRENYFYNERNFIIEIPGQLTREGLEQQRDEYINGASWNTFENNAFLNNYSNPNIDSWMRFYAVDDRDYTQYVQNNYWGNVSQTIMDKVIVDYQSGNFNRGTVLYKPMLTVAPESAYPFVKDVYLTNKVGETIDIASAEEVKVNVLFNRDMDATIHPQVSFGPDAPYTDFTVREDDGQWITPRHYQGKINITSLSGDGRQFFRVAGAVAADDKWLVTGNDSERFGFEIITSGTEAMNLQASGGENKVTLSWMQDEFDLLAGYNIYRSNALDGTYKKTNDTLIPYEEKTYEDNTVEPGKTYFYKFTVVQTDLEESDYSNVAFAAAYDTFAPVIVHIPIESATPGVNLQIYADITDNIKVLGAKLYYRTSGETSFICQEMIKGDGDRYIANLPGSSVKTPGLDYYIEATDGASTVRNGRADEPHKVVVDDSPKINTITPNTGSSNGLTPVTIMGSNFKEGAKIYFGQMEALNIKLISANQLTATTPQHYPALVDVKIVNPDGNENILLKGYTFKSEGIPLSISNSNGNIGNFIEIPVHIQEVEGLKAIDLKINYDPEVLKFINVKKDILTSNFTISSNGETQGQIIISLASGTVINGTGNIAKIEFKVLDSEKAGTDIIIEEARLNSGNINVDLIAGRFDYTPTYQISGSINYFKDNRPISDTVLKLNGDRNYSKSTNDNGEYILSGIDTGDYKLYPSKNNQASDISAYDASLILQHVVKKINLNNYQKMAADVDQNDEIDSMDASYILEHVVGLLATPFPGAGCVWKFSPKDIDINNITGDLTYNNFEGILLGDVSGNWNTGTEIQALSNVSYSVGSKNVNPGDRFLIPIEINLNDEKIYATEITLTYDEDMLEPISINKTDLSNDFALTNNTNKAGEIKIALAGATPINSNGNLVNIEFQAKNIAGISDLIIIDSQCNEDKIVNITNGHVNISKSKYHFKTNILKAIYNSITESIDIDIDIKNIDSQIDKSILCLALYRNNKVVNILVEEVSLSENQNTTLQRSIMSSSVPNSEYKIKAFLWESLYNINLLADATEETLE